MGENLKIASKDYLSPLLRRIRGQQALERAPRLTVQTMDEPIAYQQEILRTALPYGLASDFWRDDDNDYRANDFRARYISALQDTMRVRAEPITDVY